jgi:5-methylthioribose kinase
VVKQALPYAPGRRQLALPLKRSFFEYHALTSRGASARLGAGIYHFDEGQALIIMEYLSPHIILRRALIEGRRLPNIANDIGLFMARTLFRGSDLHMAAKDRKADLALFADNVELCDITENLVFSDPYFDAKMNRHTRPQLDGLVAELRADRDLKVEAQRLKHIFAANAEKLLHGDRIPARSWSPTETGPSIRNSPHGPIAFDVGMLLANFWMAFFSPSMGTSSGKRDAMRAYLLDVTAETGGFPRRVLICGDRAHRHALPEKPVRDRYAGSAQSRRSTTCCIRSGQTLGLPASRSPAHPGPRPQRRFRDHCRRGSARQM